MRFFIDLANAVFLVFTKYNGNTHYGHIDEVIGVVLVVAVLAGSQNRVKLKFKPHFTAPVHTVEGTKLVNEFEPAATTTQLPYMLSLHLEENRNKP